MGLLMLHASSRSVCVEGFVHALHSDASSVGCALVECELAVLVRFTSLKVYVNAFEAMSMN